MRVCKKKKKDVFGAAYGLHEENTTRNSNGIATKHVTLLTADFVFFSFLFFFNLLVSISLWYFLPQNCN